jgi:Salmonella virulence plasmid 65kDa B protein/FG-GAP-like repeat/Insecticide toxin TcdB middle/N-terminal region
MNRPTLNTTKSSRLIPLMWMLCLIALSTFISILTPTTAQAATPFTTNANFSVGSDGSANYSIPIQVPPGTAGMAPTLSLNYNSNGGNGILGMGWGLDGLSQISRCPKTIIQDGAVGGVNYDVNDKLCIDGQRLISTGGTYGANATEYRTEQANFAKIISTTTTPANGPDSFKVWTKAGQVIEYGNTTDSRIEAAAKTIIKTWGVNKISDTKGNYITITYTEDNPNGEAYIQRIDYTGNATSTPALAPYANIQFIYEARPDPSTGYHAGSIIKQTKRITNIKTYTNSTTLVKDYRLTYEQSAATQRSRLKTLTECDGNTTTPICQQTTTFGWQDNTYTGFAWPPVTGSSVTVATGNFAAHAGTSADVNGDGKVDVVSINPATTGLYVYTAIGKGDGTFFPLTGTTLFAANFTGHNVMLGDVNADGKPDVVTINPATTGLYVYTAIGKGDGTFLPATGATLLAANFTGHKVMLGDVNADGKPDVVTINPATTGLYVYTAIGKGDGTFLPATGVTLATYNATGATGQTVDVNGDGKDDIVTQVGISVVGSAISKGDGTFYPYTLPNVPWSIGGLGLYEPGYINGDGMLDLISVAPTNAALYAFPKLNNSTGIPDLLTSITPGLTSTTSLTYKPITDGSVYVKDAIGAAGTGTCPMPLGGDGVTTNSYPIINLQEPQYLVSTATVTDGNGGVLTNNYNYGGLKAHLTGRGSLGFRYQKVSQVDPDVNSTTFFRQDYPYIGLPCQTEKKITSSNTLIGASALTYANSPITTGTAVSQFPYLSQSVEQNFELSGTLINTTTTTNQYDSYGNATQISVNSGDGYVKTTTNVYNNDSTNWLLGRLLKSTVTSTSP